MDTGEGFMDDTRIRPICGCQTGIARSLSSTLFIIYLYEVICECISNVNVEQDQLSSLVVIIDFFSDGQVVSQNSSTICYTEIGRTVIVV